MGHLYSNVTDTTKNVHRYYVTTMLICGMLTNAVISRHYYYFNIYLGGFLTIGATVECFRILRRLDAATYVAWSPGWPVPLVCASAGVWAGGLHGDEGGVERDKRKTVVNGNYRLFIKSPSSSFNQSCCNTSEPARSPIWFHLKLQRRRVAEGVNSLLHTSCFCVLASCRVNVCNMSVKVQRISIEYT